MGRTKTNRPHDCQSGWRDQNINGSSESSPCHSRIILPTTGPKLSRAGANPFEHLRSFKSSPALILSLQRPFSFLSPSRAPPGNPAPWWTPSGTSLLPPANHISHSTLPSTCSLAGRPLLPPPWVLRRRAMVAAATVDTGGQARTHGGRRPGGRRSAIFWLGVERQGAPGVLRSSRSLLDSPPGARSNAATGRRVSVVLRP
jgi:hypothetical protein